MEKQTDKTNVIKPNDPDLFKLVSLLVKEQLEANDPDYDGSYLTLGTESKKETKNGNV